MSKAVREKTVRTQEEARDMQRTHLCNLSPQEARDPPTHASDPALLPSVLTDPHTLVDWLSYLTLLQECSRRTRRSGSQATHRLASWAGNLCCSIFHAGVSRQIVALILQKELLRFVLSGDCG